MCVCVSVSCLMLLDRWLAPCRTHYITVLTCHCELQQVENTHTHAHSLTHTHTQICLTGLSTWGQIYTYVRTHTHEFIGGERYTHTHTHTHTHTLKLTTVLSTAGLNSLGPPEGQQWCETHSNTHTHTCHKHTHSHTRLPFALIQKSCTTQLKECSCVTHTHTYAHTITDTHTGVYQQHIWFSAYKGAPAVCVCVLI